MYLEVIIIKAKAIRLTCLILIFAALSAFVYVPSNAATATSGFCGANGSNVTWEWEVDNYTLTISGTGAMTDYTSPSSRRYATYVSAIKNIVIEDGVTHIGDWVFSYCSSLKNVTIPDSVMSIGDNAFFGCSRLTSVTLPESVTSIGNRVFCDCGSLTSMNIPDGVTFIEDRAFAACSSLTSITIPDSVTSIGDWAFSGCSSLTSIMIPDSVTSIGDDAFSDCSSLTSIMIPDSVTSMGSSAFSRCSGLTSITIPDSVTSIGNSVFSGCRGLTNIIIPDNVTSIGDNAFDSCGNLTSITIPDSLASIGDDAFYNCDILAEVYYNGDISDFLKISIGNNNNSFINAKLHCNNTVVINYGMCGDTVSYYIDETGTLGISGTGAITDYYFSSVPWYDFRSEIKNIVIEDGVTNIGDSAFCDCSTLTNVTISDSVISIGDDAFDHCDSLAAVYYNGYISDFLKISIGNDNDDFMNAKLYCTDIVSIDYGTCGEGISYYLDEAGTLNIIGTGAMEAYSYSSDAPWYIHRLEIKNIIIGDGITSIGDYAFYNCSNLTNITIPDSVTGIGNNAFSYCSSLTSITIPDSVTNIGDYAFYYCSSLTEVHYNGSFADFLKISVGSYNDDFMNTKLYCADIVILDYGICGEGVSYYIDEVGTLNINGLGTMADYSYSSDAPWYDFRSGIKNVIIEDGVTNISDYAFYNCGNLTSITIPDSVTSIGYRAFYGCSSLTSITIPHSMTIIGNSAFYNCDSLTSITIPDSVTSIGNSAFYGCSNLTSITIPDSVTSIGNSAFDHCSSLTEVHYNGSFADFLKISVGNDNDDFINAKHHCIDMIFYQFGTCGESVSYYLDETDTLNIMGTGAIADYSYSSYVPWYDYRSKVKNVIIEDGVTSIGDNAFYYCSSLTSITIPDSITSIGDDAFRSCSSLTEVHYNGSLADFLKISVGNYNDDFMNAKHHCIDIIFYQFGTCGESVSYYLDETGTLDINGAGAMTDYSYSSDTPWYKFRSEIKNVVIEDGVTSIGNSAFRSSSLISITIPDSVTSIGDYAFSGCDNLAEAHYNGSFADFLKISIGSDNDDFMNAKLYCTDIVSIDYGTCGEGISYYLDEAGTLNIIGTGAMEAYSYSSDAPWYSHRLEIKNIIIGDGVTSIGDYACYDCSSLASVTIPNGVTSIGNSAFSACSSLTSITIPDSVTSIGDYAFRSCSSLTSITIPDSVTSIGNSAFSGCSGLTSITIPDSVTSIGNNAFSGCSSLTSITIPDNVTSIGYQAFSKCDSLAEVHYNGSFTELCEIVTEFGSASYIRIFSDAKIYCGETEIIEYGDCGEGVSYCFDINGTLTVSGDGEMSHDTYNSYMPWDFYRADIKRVVIEGNVTSIYWEAFDNCMNLTDVTIGGNISEWGAGAFSSCQSLKNVTIINGVTNIGSAAFSGCVSLEYITIPDSVTSIGSAAFYDCDSLEHITIPDTVTTIGVEAFHGCKNLKGIIIPNKVQKIRDGSFENCNSLENVVIPDSMQSIGNCAFRGCTNLKNLMIPANVTHIDLEAFEGCTSLISIDVDSKNEKYFSVNGIMFNKEQTEILLYPKARAGSYTVPSSVTRLGDYAFKDCMGLTEIIVPAGVQNMGIAVFSGCTALENVSLPNTIKSIEREAFKACSGLKNIIIPEGVKNISEYAFSDCYNLKNVMISNGVISIETNAFCGCTSLEYITIPGSVESIGVRAFGDCSMLKAFEVDKSNQHYMSIDGVLFNKSQTELICYPTRKSGSYIIPNEVEHIGNYAFYGCLGLLSVDIPDSVAIIGTNAFGGCDNLKKVYTNKDFRNIIIQDGNECLTEAAIHYNDDIVMNDDVIITIYASESNIITYKLKTENPENYVDCDIYATVYNSNGGANDIGHAEFDEDGKAEISINTDEKSIKSKIFIWDKNMRPLCPPVEFELD